jgi:tetratricopeptide (TPR) repeat protein
MVRHWCATFLVTIRAFLLALREIDTAQTLDLESTAILDDKGLILFYSGKRDDALKLLQQLEQAAPAFSSLHAYLASINLDRGDSAAFLRELKADAAIRRDSLDEELAAAGEKALSERGRGAMFTRMAEAQEKQFAEAGYRLMPWPGFRPISGKATLRWHGSSAAFHAARPTILRWRSMRPLLASERRRTTVACCRKQDYRQAEGSPRRMITCVTASVATCSAVR